MKKVVNLVIIIGIAMMIPGMAYSQASVVNKQANKIVLVKDGNTLTINPGSSSFASWFPAAGAVQFHLSYYDNNLNRKDLGQVTREIVNGKLIINSYEKVVGSAANVTNTVSVVSPTINSDNLRSDCWSQVSITVKNVSSYRFVALGEPFNKLSLRAGQSSNLPKILCTGEYIFSVKYNKETDDSSTGREYSWAVIDKIIAEGDSVIAISDWDLEEKKTEKIKKVVRNEYSKDFLVMNGRNKGRVIAASSQTKLDMDVGWNVLCIQYKDIRDIPIQATILVLANESPRPLMMNQKKGVISSINPEGISLDNWSPPAKK
ncbi:TPA: hypothetical protein DCZ15_00805 [Candidatus Falkowbacteria bacterium]|nr:MAG: hypothetical protein UV95_C0003G0022 [Candidatus Falkowbacteria bacterium GW2011_GWF2_43_32]HBA36394.1 hypothetical protein [Candidatus Falkowbacteria bacterium]